MKLIKSWEWGREGVDLYEDHLTWYERETAVRFASGAARDQTINDFLRDGPPYGGVPPEVVTDLTKAIHEQIRSS